MQSIPSSAPYFSALLPRLIPHRGTTSWFGDTFWFTIAYVPIEEYSYFNLETLVCLLWFWQFPNVDEIKLPPSSHLCKSNAAANDKSTPSMHKWQKQFQTYRRWGYLILISSFLFGVYCIHVAGGICFESVEHFTKDSLYGLLGLDSEYQYYRHR